MPLSRSGPNAINVTRRQPRARGRVAMHENVQEQGLRLTRRCRRRGMLSARRQRIAEPRVPRQPAAKTIGGGQERRLGVDPDRQATEPLRLTSGLFASVERLEVTGVHEQCRGHVSQMAGAGFEPAKAEPRDLQSRPFDRSGIPPRGRGV